MEINKPEHRTYWVARSENGEILSVGYTEPNQVTTSGQSVLVIGDRSVQIQEVSKFRGNPEAFNYEWNGNQWVFAGDDVIYIPTKKANAEPLSKALFSIVFGPSKIGLYAKVIHHPSGQGFSLLEVNRTDVVPVSIAADPQPLVDVLKNSVSDGNLTQAELDGIVGAIQVMGGKTVELIDFIPPSWQRFVMSREQAKAAGYFE